MEAKIDDDIEEPKKSLSDCLNYDEMYCFQKILYYFLYPFLWIFDCGCINRREHIQLPLLTYLISITRLIIAITWVELMVEGLIVRSTTNTIDTALVAFYLFLYTIVMLILCLLLLYTSQKFNYSTPFHYHYFVELSTHVTGYGLLYLSVQIQYEWYSDLLEYTWIFCFELIILSCLLIAIIIVIKQFGFNLSMNDRIFEQYQKFLEFYNMPDNTSSVDDNNDNNDNNNQDETELLIPNNNNNSDKKNKKNKHYINYDAHRNDRMEEIEMHNFWFTILSILQNMWPIAIGFILIECVIYTFTGSYVNLLVSWDEEETSILNNIWPMIIFGFVCAIITAVTHSFVEIKCKVPCYEYVDKTHNNNPGVCHQLVLFLFNWLNDIGNEWNSILASAIGWSLLTPNQASRVSVQLQYCLFGTFGFVLFGLFSGNWKHKKQSKIVKEMKSIKNDQNEINKEKKLKSKVRRLILYERLVETYNAAFAVSVSFAWESFASLSLESTFKGVYHRGWLLWGIKLIYTVSMTVVFIQFGLELSDLRRQRLHEAIRKKSQSSNASKLALQLTAQE